MNCPDDPCPGVHPYCENLGCTFTLKARVAKLEDRLERQYEHARDVNEEMKGTNQWGEEQARRAEAAEARAAYAEALWTRMQDWVDKYEADTRALPAQHEHEGRGSSSFNWRMTFVRELREAMQGQS